MKIISTSSRGNFTITDKSDGALVELMYANWFSSKANATFNGQAIEIRPKNVWQSKFDIFVNEADRGDITFNWKGHIIILFNDKSYLLKKISIWKISYELLNEHNARLLKIRPNLKWKKLKYDYEIQDIDNSLKGNELTELLLFVGFATNLHMLHSMNT